MSWNPSPGQRRVAFAGTVVVLAAAGVYLTFPGFRPDQTAHGAPRPAATRSVAAAVTPTPTDSASPRASARASASPTPEETSARDRKSSDARRLLPLPASDLTDAARAAERFVAAYTTYRYDESARAYAKRLRPLAADPLRNQLDGGSAAPAGRAEMKRREVVAKGHASVEKARMIATDSAVFVVASRQRITTTKGKRTEHARYAVTAVHTAGEWRVSNLAPAKAGDVGDVGNVS